MGIFDKLLGKKEIATGDAVLPESTVTPSMPKIKRSRKGPKVTPAEEPVPAESPASVKKTTAKKKTKVAVNPAKDEATANGDPWVNVIQVELDPDNIGNGAFELDWNDIFVARLIKAGYEGKTDADIVDRWFQSICRNILAENYEQWEANQGVGRQVNVTDIGSGRTSRS